MDKKSASKPVVKATDMAIKRINSEYANLLKDPPLTGFSAGFKDKNNIFIWDAMLTGPDGTPYEKGLFNLTIEFPKEYPYKPPKMKFVTKIYHMNISDKGDICLDILKDNWSPALNITKVLLSISSLLADPNPKDPLMPALATLYLTDKKLYEKTAREWKTRYT